MRLSISTVLSVSLLFALGAACPAQEGTEVVEIGDPMPRVEADRLWNASFGGIDNLRGKLVLYYWFLPEDGGSRKLKTAMNVLYLRHRRQGFEVVGISHRDEEKLASWVRRYRPKFAVAWEPSNLSMGSLYFQAWPSAALVSPRGRVVLKGTPTQVTDAIVRKHLRGATGIGPDAPLRLALDLPASLEKVSRLLEDGKLDRALDEVEKERAAAPSPDETAALDQVVQAVEKLLDSTLRGARWAAEDRRYYQAELLYERILKHGPGTPAAARAEAALRAFKKDTAILRELRGGKKLYAAQLAMERDDDKRAARLLKPLTSRQWEGTAVQARAKALLEKLP